jgi:hypothetical protein
MSNRCNCDECVDDPTLTCSYTGEDISVEAVYVANAYKGHLVLCPGGSNGLIGGLLHQLDPPQHYSHMGIAVSDFDLFRHCTALPSRLTAEEYYEGSVFGVAAPVDGLKIDHVQYGWPGAVTQSARQIHYAGRYADIPVPGTSQPYRGSNLVDPESSSGDSYRVAAMSFDGVFDDDGRFYPALVVKPCPMLETPQCRAALAAVADEALDIYAHYRFYCYTDGAVASDPNYQAKPWKVPAAKPDWNPDTLEWRDWSDPAAVQWLDEPTIPGVCSSFVWQAVQNVSQRNPRILLDWAGNKADALGEANGVCRRSLKPDWSADTTDASTLDGLMFYDSDSRRRAASWLKDSLAGEVYTSLKAALEDAGGVQKTVADAIDMVGRGTFIAAASDGAASLAALLAPVLGGIAGVALAEQLIELLYDLPNDVANQVCNSFAFDCHRGFPGDLSCVDGDGNPIRDIDSTNFVDAPGVGRAVSPDNIYMFWDAPGPSDKKIIRGLYGYNEPVALVVAVLRKPLCELVPSPGLATLFGVVRRDGQYVRGAVVKVNCQRSTALDNDGYQLKVRAGGYHKVVARWRDPNTGMILYGERVTGRPGKDPPLGSGQSMNVDIDLSEPPVYLRNVTVTGLVRVDDVYLTGVDHAQTQYAQTLYVQYGVPFYNEDSGNWDVDTNDAAGAARLHDTIQVGAAVGDAGGNLRIDVTAREDLAVDVRLAGTIKNLSKVVTVTVADAATVTVPEFSLDTGGPFNDRVYFRNITITNAPAQAI